MSESSSPLISGHVMAHVYDLALKTSRVDFPVLILGETGVGKEVLARDIHANSNGRSSGNFVAVNCGAIPESLLESELFGYVKGAFTGAVGEKMGLIEMADGGTLFLDEIAEMSFHMQAELLTVIENKEYRKVGAVELKKANFRLICATNKDLIMLVQNHLFRDDLYYRVNTIEIKIPPLRERKDEIVDIVKVFLRELGYGQVSISPEVMEIFLCYSWPGNLRELKSVIESSITELDSHEQMIDIKHLPEEKFSVLSCWLIKSNDSRSLLEMEHCFRKNLIKNAMEFYGGDYKKVMSELKISKDVIYRSIKNGGGKHTSVYNAKIEISNYLQKGVYHV
ncbi:MAG: sigma 54-interacting transcriptional regulator [Bacteroidetes bacterium]|nr:sigma 54-interacting transcriptional regulator [Bacteroidota bacterium]